ncbi:MAG: flippase-like domain-containing protein [Planctomycetota bacterium]
MKKKILLAVLLLLLLVFVIADGKAVIVELSGARLRWVTAAIGASFVSYLWLAFSLKFAARAVKLRLPLVAVLGVSLSSAVMNHVVVGAGAGTFALRLILFQRFGVPAAHALTVTGLATASSNVALCVIAGAGLFLVVASGSVSGWEATVAMAGIGIVLVASFLALVMLFNPRWRRRIAEWASHLLNALRHRFLKKPSPTALTTDRFFEELDESLSRVRAPVQSLIPVILLSLCDWGASVVCLGCCFLAVGVPVAPGILVAAYSVGTLASLVAFLPGGLGVLEGSMAAIFTHFGVNLETAISAILLFRVAYYFVPSAFCFVFFHRAVHRITKEAVVQSWHAQTHAAATAERASTVAASPPPERGCSSPGE